MTSGSDTPGTPGTIPGDVDAARSERVLQKSRIQEAVAEIREVLHEDLEQFVLRKVRKAFLDHPERASAMADADIASLKAATEAGASRKRDEILVALEADELWLDPGEPAEDAQGLRGNMKVWGAISAVTECIEGLLKDAGFETALPAPDYEEPKRFIRSRLLTNLTERYWTALAAYQKADEAIASISHQNEQTKLAKRWDDA